jgi:adenosine deaminase
VTAVRLRDLRQLPKAHLHLHLEGGMRPSTLVDLSKHYAAPMPDPPDGSFATFIRLYRAAAAVLRVPDDYVRLVHEVVQDAAADGVVWLEPAEWLAPGQPERLGLADAQAVLDLLLDAARQASASTGVAVGWMVATNRTRPVAEAVSLARLAARYAGRGVVSFGLADDETKGRPEPFAPAFDIARAAGLIPSPHAGEHGGPDSVRGALDALGARRIQHGVRSAEDPQLLRRLAGEGVCLDVCPTSNVQLRVVTSLATHPLPALLDAGVNVSLNADDPLFFGSGVLAEYELARHSFGLDDAALARVAACSIRASGAPAGLKDKALADIDSWLLSS